MNSQRVQYLLGRHLSSKMTFLAVSISSVLSLILNHHLLPPSSMLPTATIQNSSSITASPYSSPNHSVTWCDFLPQINLRASLSCLMYSHSFSPCSSTLLASHLSIKGFFENPSQNIHIEETRFPVYIPDRTIYRCLSLYLYLFYVRAVSLL